jgi:hypothetical protein
MAASADDKCSQQKGNVDESPDLSWVAGPTMNSCDRAGNEHIKHNPPDVGQVSVARGKDDCQLVLDGVADGGT